MTFRGEKRSTYRMRLEIQPVNDAPRFQLNSGLSVISLREASEISPERFSFATNIFPGPLNERVTCVSAHQQCDSQTYTFQTAHITDPHLFAWTPFIDIQGELTFALAPNVTGSATVSGYLQDSGGLRYSADGLELGSDRTALYTFTVVVTAVNAPPAFAFEKDVDCTVEGTDGKLACVTSPAADARGQVARVKVLQRKGSDTEDSGMRSFADFASLISPARSYVPGSKAVFDLGMSTFVCVCALDSYGLRRQMSAS